MNLAHLERESDRRTQALLDKAIEQEASNFNAKEHLSILVMPYQDNKMIFRQQGRRVKFDEEGVKALAQMFQIDVFTLLNWIRDPEGRWL